LSFEEHASPTARQVLVTGTSRNVGAHLANRFLDDGFAVIAQYRSETDELKALAERGAALVQGDFSDASACQAIAEQIAAQATSLTTIVHNASAFSPTPADSADAAAQFQAFFAVHMLAPYLLNTRLAPVMQANIDTPGDIIHITDIYADNPAAEYDIYCATKAGLQNLALSQAKRFAPRLKVNAIQPGPLSFEDWHDDSSREAVIASTPLQRAGAAEHIYIAVRALMLNDFQTGAVVPVDGGRRLGR